MAVPQGEHTAGWPLTGYLAQLRAQRADLAARYHIHELGVFGSYVRNTQHPASDLDVLVSFTTTHGLFTLVALEDELSTLLGITVDLAVKTALRPHIAARILDELVPVCARRAWDAMMAPRRSRFSAPQLPGPLSTSHGSCIRLRSPCLKA